MRVDRLDLTRFGHFSDFSLNFGNAPDGPDLHLVYGPNEAGKSTTLAALVDLLFGMPRSSDFDFLHQYQTLELGACLTQANTSQELRRFKNRLTDAERNQLSDSVIDVHGLSREEFRNRFSFDDSALQEGGESILENKGDLGAALFSATSGLSDLAQRMNTAMAAHDRFDDGSKSRKTDLYGLRKELAEIDKKRKQIDIEAPAWKRFKRDAENAQQRFVEQEKKVQECQRALDALQQQQRRLTTAQRIDTLRHQLVAFDALPDVPADWHARLIELQPRRIELMTRLETQKKRHAELDAQKKSVNPDKSVLQHAPTIRDLLAQRLVARQRANDILELAGTLERTQHQLDSLLLKLDLPRTSKAEEIATPEPSLLRLEQLARQHVGLQSAVEHAKQETSQLEQREKAIADSDTSAPPDITTLESLLKQIRNEAPQAQLRQASARAREYAQSLEEALRELQPWRGDAEALALQSPPSVTHLRELASRTQTHEEALRLQQNNVAQCAAKGSTIDQEIERITAGTSIDDDAAHAAREKRNAAWQTHTDALDTGAEPVALQRTARDVARTMGEDDVLSAARLLESDRVARIRQLQHDAQTQRHALSTLQTALSEATQVCEATQRETIAIAQALQLPDTHGANDIERWLAIRVRAMQAMRDNQTYKDEQANWQQRCTTLVQRLVELLTPCVPGNVIDQLANADIDECLALAEQTVERLRTEHQHYTHALEERTSLTDELTQRRDQLSAHNDAMATWQLEWQAALGTSWFAKHDAEVVASLLPEMRTLATALDKRNDLQEQIKSLERDQQRYATDTAMLHEKLRSTPPEDSARPIASPVSTELVNTEDALVEMEQWLKTTEQEQSTLEHVASEKATLDAVLEELQAEVQPIEQQIAEMQSSCKVETVVELQKLLEQNRDRVSLNGRLQEYLAELVDEHNVPMTESAISVLSQLDSSVLVADIRSREDQLNEERERLNECHHTYRTAQDALNTMAGEADAAKLMEQRENLLLEVKERAFENLRARIGRAVVLEGLRRFRDQHRSGMMQRARDTFLAITCGNFSDLRSHPDDKGVERLFAVKRDGGTQLSANMSTGTRFQLYLALRIAAYHEYCQHRTPLPFVADDIMETFDDERSAAAFTQLAEMAKHGQVIYLTHHRHLIDIAKRVVAPNLSVHELPARIINETNAAAAT